MHAIDGQDFSTVTYILDKFPNLINCFFGNHKYSTPVVRCCLGNHHMMLKMLLARGADPNLKLENEVTPLMTAAQKGHIYPIQYLIEAKADVLASNKKGFTALDIAIINGFYNAAQIIKN